MAYSSVYAWEQKPTMLGEAALHERTMLTAVPQGYVPTTYVVTATSTYTDATTMEMSLYLTNENVNRLPISMLMVGLNYFIGGNLAFVNFDPDGTVVPQYRSVDVSSDPVCITIVW